MGALDDLKTRIDEAIYQNTQQKITGEVLQDTLEDMVDTMGVSVSQNSSTGHTDINIGSDSYPVASIDDITNIGYTLNNFGAPIFLRHGYVDSSNGITFNDELQGYLVLIAKIEPSKSYMYFRKNGSGAGLYANYFDKDFISTGSYYQVTSNQWVEVSPSSIPEGSVYFAMNVRWSSETLGNTNGCSFVEKTPLLEKLWQIADGSITTPKLADGAVKISKVDMDLLNNIVKTNKKANLFNEACTMYGYFINNNGQIQGGVSKEWSMSHFIPVSPNTTYRIGHPGSEGTGRGQGFLWLDENYNIIGGSGSVTVFDAHTSPQGARYMAFNINMPDVSRVENVVVLEQSGVITKWIPFNTISKQCIENLVISYDELNSSVKDNILKAIRTNNLFNYLEIVNNQYVNNSGGIGVANGWATTNFIPVEAGESYYISAEVWTRGEGFAWYDANLDLISEGSGGITIAGLHTAPENAAYMIFNMANSNLNYSKKVMVVKGTSAMSWEPYNQIGMDQIKGLIDAIQNLGFGKLTLTKDGNNVTVTDGTYTISSKLENNYGNIYSGNPVFNLDNGDDIAPMHILGTTIGANHGQPCVRATISNHGLDNTSIGTGWLKDGITYYIMRIVDANNIIFLSENRGSSATSPSFVNMEAGNITNGGTTLTVTSVTSSQLYPALKNHSVKVVDNRNNEITEDGVYYSDSFDIVESYDIMNPVSILQNIIARAGQSGEPVYDGDVAVKVENVYRFTKTMSVLVIVNVLPLQNVSFSDIMFAQAARIGANGVVKYYVPNSLPLGSYDMRKPLAMTWSSEVSGTFIGTAQMADPTHHPVNRVIQYDESNHLGFALGFLTNSGVGADLLDYTSYTFELRNNTGKVYPHGVDSAKSGTPLVAGTFYSAIMYRSRFAPETSGNRLSMYHFDLNGVEYVFVDYSASMLDKVVVDETLNGRKVEVVESVNTTLKTDIYNGGFYIDATYVEGETCYMICKIE